MSNILSTSLNAAQKRCLAAQRSRRGLEASHQAYIFEGHGLDFIETSLRQEDGEHIREVVNAHAPSIMLYAGHRTDFHLRGHTPHPP